MKIFPEHAFADGTAQEISTCPILAFVSSRYQGLWHAAHLLGGYESARLVDRCIDLLVHDERVTPRANMMLEQILAVLSLEKVDDPNLPYMGHFAAIDPLDPVIEQICLLTDGLRGVLGLNVGETDNRRVA